MALVTIDAIPASPFSLVTETTNMYMYIKIMMVAIVNIIKILLSFSCIYNVNAKENVDMWESNNKDFQNGSKTRINYRFVKKVLL